VLARRLFGHWLGSAHDAARPCCRLRASAAHSAAPQAGLNRRDLARHYDGRSADEQVWGVVLPRGFFVRLTIRIIWPDGVCMPRPASAKLASARPASAKAEAGACPWPRLTQQKLGNRRWGEEE
jgi:hypothetical protein